MKTLAAVLTILYFTPLAHGYKHKPSTPEERQRMVNLAHKLEDSPLDESLHSEIQWGIKWLTEAPDITVHVCIGPLDKFFDADYKYEPSHFVAENMFSSAAFLIEHPEKASDKNAEQTAGLEGVLKAYSAVLKKQPDARSDVLDDLVKRQGEGTLANYVQEKCNAKK